MRAQIVQKPNIRLVSLTLVATLTACVSTPSYVSPALPHGTSFLATDPTVRTKAPIGVHVQVPQLTEGHVDRAWWRTLGSPALDALVDEALRASPTLAAAQSALDQAREAVSAQSGSMQLPQAEFGVGTQRQQISPSAQGLAGYPREFSVYSASVAVRYRFDFGGGIDSGLRALAARADVRRHELTAAQHALVAHIATTAITRARLAEQIEIQLAIANTQSELLRLAGVRARWGQASPEEVSVLAAQAEITRGSLPLLRKQMQQAEHLLSILVGRQPSQGAPSISLSDFSLPRQIPVSVPSEWALQRPDIRAAEATLRAAHADLGVVYARQYPQLNISANLGSQALTTSALFGGAAAIWGAGAQLAQPLFNAGLPAERRVAQAAFAAAQANYQRVVLEALRNVADGLRAVELDTESHAAFVRGVQAVQEQHLVLERQLRAGTANPAQLLAINQLLMQARFGLISAQAQRLTNTVALSAALVGGP